MITHIKVDGFKSLTAFELNFTPGLNILVGPNGSGKTNIVSFFEYLADLLETDASEATSRVGGAGAVFRRMGEDYAKKITVNLTGSVSAPPDTLRKLEPEARTEAEQRPFYAYSYSFVLVFPESRDSVLFETQRLCFRRARAFRLHEPLRKVVHQWGVDIEAKVDATGTLVAKVNSYDPTLLELPFFRPADGKKGSKEPREWLESLLTGMLSSNMSLLTMVSRFTSQLWPIASDITGGTIYNIVPSAVKLPEDSAKPPGLARDGSGLAATLYALQRTKTPDDYSPWYYVRRPTHPVFGSDTLDQLKEYLRLVNTTIDDISVSNDPFDNQLRVRFHLRSGDYDATLPLTLMSDGTLKWIALVTAALTASSVFSVEEPENYLHPQMQGQIVAILREILFARESNRFTLMTTHSESLLNNCKPEELIITSMIDGRPRTEIFAVGVSRILRSEDWTEWHGRQHRGDCEACRHTCSATTATL